MKGEHQISPPKTMLRRSFLWASPLFPLAVRPTKRVFSQQRSSASPGQQSRNSQSVEAFLREHTYTREEVAAFLDSNQTNVVRFDPELGYMGNRKPGQPQLTAWAAGIFPDPHSTPLATLH